MLTPVFQCEQDKDFIIVRIILSAICKVLDASFDINGEQFTFYCSPYYLRLRFAQRLAEGRGERATYELETNTLTVHVPKEVPGEEFTQLDNPAFLIATEKERRVMVSAVGEEDDGEAGEEEETEFKQTLHDEGSRVVDEASETAPSYGFANAYNGLFKRLDEDVVQEVMRLPRNPDAMSAAERRALRLEKETNDFDEDAVLVCFEDEDGEIARLLAYAPAHMLAFRAALQGSKSRRVASAPSAAAAPSTALDAAYEEEEATLLVDGAERPVTVWRGNIADFRKPLIEEVPAAGAEEQSRTEPNARAQTPSEEAQGTSQPTQRSGASPRITLAIPAEKPVLTFSMEENEVLMRLRLPRLLFPPSSASVAALTADLLFAEAYDDLVTEGAGCSETLWNLTELSPALSWLDPADNLYDACLFFARRAMIYPLHRHMALVQRVWAMVGTRLLLGKHYVVRALLRVRNVLAHAEHKHVLCSIFLDPLVAYWMNAAKADEMLTQAALEIHEHASRSAAVTVDRGSENSVRSVLQVNSAKVTWNPLNLLSLGLPFSADEK